MNLKPKERASILAGQFPELVRPEKPELGQEIVLKSSKARDHTPIPEVSIRVLSARKLKNGWKVEYLVKDDRGLYASQGLGYTRSPVRALDPTAPILDPETIESYSQEAQQTQALLQAEHFVRQNTEKAEARAGRGPQAEAAAERAKRRADG